MAQIVGLVGYALLALFMVGYATGKIAVSEYAFGIVIGAGSVAVIATQVFLFLKSKQKKAMQF